MPRNLWPWLVVLAITLVVAPWLALQAHLAGEPVERQARALERSLRCPVCEGQSVADSNSAVALQMREEIRSLLAQGKTPEQVLDYFADRYGPWVIFMPPRRGVFLAGWLLPFVALAGGGWVLHRWLRTRPQHQQQGDASVERDGTAMAPGSHGEPVGARADPRPEEAAAPPSRQGPAPADRRGPSTWDRARDGQRGYPPEDGGANPAWDVREWM